jgi:hypothetical protein
MPTKLRLRPRAHQGTSALSILILVFGPLLCFVLSLSTWLIALFQEWGYTSTAVLYRRTWLDPAVYLPLLLCGSIGFVTLGLLYRTCYHYFGTHDGGLPWHVQTSSVVLGLVFSGIAGGAVLFVMDFYNPGIKVDIPLPPYRIVIVQRTTDLDYPDLYLYVFDQKGSYYREPLYDVSWDCLPLDVSMDKPFIVIRAQCDYPDKEREVVRIHTQSLALWTQNPEGQSFRFLQTLRFEDQ